MTREEAIKITANYDVGSCGYCHQGGDEVAEAFKMAIKALEKQIPKKPYDIVCCPSCKIEVELQPIDIEQVTYCLHCGQAIDWSEAE